MQNRKLTLFSWGNFLVEGLNVGPVIVYNQGWDPRYNCWVKKIFGWARVGTQDIIVG